MSRSGYSDEGDQWDMIRWRGAVASATFGQRGQQFLKDFRVALDEMPKKKLYVHYLQTESGQSCSLGVIGAARGINMIGWDPESHEKIADSLDIARALVCEIEYLNDDFPNSWAYQQPDRCSDKQKEVEAQLRWQKMRNWVDNQIPKELA